MLTFKLLNGSEVIPNQESLPEIPVSEMGEVLCWYEGPMIALFNTPEMDHKYLGLLLNISKENVVTYILTELNENDRESHVNLYGKYKSQDCFVVKQDPDGVFFEAYKVHPTDLPDDVLSEKKTLYHVPNNILIKKEVNEHGE